MVGEDGGDLEVSKGVTMDGRVTTDIPGGWPGGDGGKTTVVAVPEWRRCDVRCAYGKGHMGCMQWALQRDSPRLQEKGVIWRMNWL